MVLATVPILFGIANMAKEHRVVILKCVECDYEAPEDIFWDGCPRCECLWQEFVKDEGDE
jgi:hypothetical protein